MVCIKWFDNSKPFLIFFYAKTEALVISSLHQYSVLIVNLGIDSKSRCFHTNMSTVHLTRALALLFEEAAILNAVQTKNTADH